ncbi:Ser/Thr protein kinase RdoA (MazF antagonist) [Amorphus suaedae]
MPLSDPLPTDPLEAFARASLAMWDVPAAADVRLINLSENATYLVTAPGGWRSVLRVHRVGYHTRRAIESELAWMHALRRDAGVPTPPVIAGKGGERIVALRPTEGAPERHLVMFEYIDGCEPEVGDDLSAPLLRLGEISARLHGHAMGWRPPAGFERLTWDEEAILGRTPTWGHWRDGPNVDARAEAVLSRLEATLRDRLRRYGKGRERYGLIHADVRLANLLVHEGETRVIDFDDSGWGWFLYDVATAFSFVEDHPKVPEWTDAWLEGYRRVRELPAEDEREIPTFVMLRRLALLAWIGSHAETDLARDLAPRFASVSCDLAEAYLARFG